LLVDAAASFPASAPALFDVLLELHATTKHSIDIATRALTMRAP
jgi:hypothetical protein